MEQLLLTAVIVTGSALYAAWVLMPAAGRRWLVRGMLAAPLPKGLADALAPYANAPTGCACDGCDRSQSNVKASARPVPASGTGLAAGVAPITFHPRRKH